VLSIAPTATGGSESSVLDSVGSMAGISGLSSLTSSGAGVECQVSINEPDDNIIIGFDADVEIQTGTYAGVAVVPTESIVLEKTGTYVYLYNEEEGTVTKTQITTGAISSTAYQVTDGISVGDKIIANPESDYEQDTFKVKVVDKK
jgi:HlyD family secretion protein